VKVEAKVKVTAAALSCPFFFMISKFILQSVVIHLAEWSVRIQWLGERHSVEPLRKY
jgi:hypothetical protein